MIAPARAPLLFFPIRSAPNEAIRGWLSGFGDLLADFDHKSLRQWKRAHPGHRAFTVVRHPLLRAHVAFHQRIVSGALADQRRTLIRAYKARLPDPGQPFGSPEDERAAFLVFLHYARLATSGQIGQRVDPNLASQTALLQGFATFHPLDLVLREESLPQSLVFLAAEVGAQAPAPPPPDAAATALTAIWDQSLEAAAAEAYARDYQGLGFGPWQS